jgi:hypothetical protein
MSTVPNREASFMKFTIREVLLCTVIAALAIGWWLDHARLTRLPKSQSPDSEYQLVVADRDSDTYILFDARSGALWRRYSDGKWISHTVSVAESQN